MDNTQNDMMNPQVDGQQPAEEKKPEEMQQPEGAAAPAPEQNAA